MLRIKVTVLLLSLVMNFHVTTSECPQMRDIPVMCPDGARGSCKTDTYTCMKTWMDLGDDLSVNACNGEYNGILLVQCSSKQWSYLICGVRDQCL